MFGRRKRTQEADAVRDDLVPIGQCPLRQKVSIKGQIVMMRAQPASALPVLRISVKDDTGEAVVDWTGRRSIAGITLGRRVIITGVAVETDGLLTFVNPEYELQD